MIRAGLPNSRQVWTGLPEHIVEMFEDVADFGRELVGRPARVVWLRASAAGRLRSCLVDGDGGSLAAVAWPTENLQILGR